MKFYPRGGGVSHNIIEVGGGGAKRFHSLKKKKGGGGREKCYPVSKGGRKKFWTPEIPFCSPAL